MEITIMNCCAVIVTFNRKDLLKECIDGILNQNLRLSHLVVIDNNSTDGTQELVQDSYNDTSNLTYINLGENRGGAGGFNAGVKWAYKNGYEWVWLMDDDVEPEENCLEIMNKFTSDSKCIHPTKRYSENGKVFNWEGYLNESSSFSVRYPTEKFRKEEFTTVNMGCFEGMLIHKEIIEKIGFPDERFFIAGDDLIYGFLASKHTPVYYLRDAEFKKKILKDEKSYFLGISRPLQSPFYLYFNTRNHFLKKDYLIKTGTGSSMSINKVLILKNIKLLAECVLFFRTNSHLKMFCLGLFDGLKRNYSGHKRFIK
jgi:GT2 family glycosyltransferase